MEIKSKIDISNLSTVEQICSNNPAFKVGGIRHLIFHAKTNGFDKCIKRIGRRVYIDTIAFAEWVEAQNA